MCKKGITLFSNKEIFLNLINEFTENEWKKDLQADKLILVDKSYILSDDEELEADIVGISILSRL